MLAECGHSLEISQSLHLRNRFRKEWLLLEVIKLLEFETSRQQPLSGLVFWHLASVCLLVRERYSYRQLSNGPTTGKLVPQSRFSSASMKSTNDFKSSR